MKYLKNYIEEAQTVLFDKMGVFFAFSHKQFDEQKKEGVVYKLLGAGLICPKENVKAFWLAHQNIVKAGIAADLAENGKEGVIFRELGNHECFYTGDIEDCARALIDYGITVKEIKAVYYKQRELQTV